MVVVLCTKIIKSFHFSLRKGLTGGNFLDMSNYWLPLIQAMKVFQRETFIEQRSSWKFSFSEIDTPKNACLESCVAMALSYFSPFGLLIKSRLFPKLSLIDMSWDYALDLVMVFVPNLWLKFSQPFQFFRWKAKLCFFARIFVKLDLDSLIHLSWNNNWAFLY